MTSFAGVVGALERAGCVAAEEEAAELVAAAAASGVEVDDLVRRRSTGEPLAWITGRTSFCGLELRVDAGVFVPRSQSEPLALGAAAAMPPTGVAVDFCTGAGAVAAVVRAHHPTAVVLATDIDPAAVACARTNGVDARLGDLDEPLPPEWRGNVDVITAVAPYVPTTALHLLPRDTIAFEPRHALDGGAAGTDVVARVIERSAAWLRAGGALLVEIGGDQAGPVTALMEASGFAVDDVLTDEEGDERAVVACLSVR